MLFLTLRPGIDQSELEQGLGRKGGAGLLWPQIETSKMTDLNEDDILELIQLKTVLLLWLAFSSLPNIAASTPETKQRQMIVFIGRLSG